MKTARSETTPTPSPHSIRARELREERRRAALAEALEHGGPALVRGYEAAALLGVSRVTLWEWTRKGILPKPGPGGWPARVIRDLIEARGA
jgi:predicted DNA-binding transcriptional regulator AlpA